MRWDLFILCLLLVGSVALNIWQLVDSRHAEAEIEALETKQKAFITNADAAAEAATESLQRAGELRKANQSLRKSLAAAREEANKRRERRKRKPLTIADAAVDIEALQTYVDIQSESLALAHAESLTLRNVLEQKELQINSLKEALKLQEPIVTAYQKREKRRKAKMFLKITGTFAAGLGAGIAIGVTR